ncbi:MAG: LamG-like jellyroll fold domain-containing protein, partial [Thermoproteota archaeon]
MQNRQEETTPPHFVQKPTTTKLTKDFTVSIEEEKFEFTKQEVTLILIKQPKIDHISTLQISEDILLSNNDGSENQIYLTKHNQIQAILERILNYRKFKFDKVVGLPLSAAPIMSWYGDAMATLQGKGVDTGDENFEQILFDIFNIVYDEIEQDLQTGHIVAALLTTRAYDDFDRQIRFTLDSAVQQSSTAVFIFAIAAIYIIVRSEEPKTKIQNYNKFLSFVFILLLASTIVITPLSISKSYYASAEMEDNATETVEPPLDSTIQIQNLSRPEVASPLEFLNVTDLSSESFNQTNSPNLENSYNDTVSPTSEPTIPVQTILSLIENVSLRGSTPYQTNTTAIPVQTILSLIENVSLRGSTPYQTNTTISTPLPNAIKSWNASATTTDSKLMGAVKVNQTGIVLDGGFIKAPGNYTNQTANLAVAAWIKPDYSAGPAVFTILSKDRSFELTLNNILYPQRIVTFSVFDGMRWHDIQTDTEISQNWSHIAATFNGTEISIYVNGTLSKTKKISPQITLDATGNRQTITPQLSQRNSDVVIGAALDSRTVDTAQRVFIGNLDEVQIYDEYITASQIHSLYQKTLPAILTKFISIEPIQIELPPISLLNQTNTNGTLNTNATQYIVIPKINHTNQITISTWVDPEYNNHSDELTVVSKDRSFVLSINNVLSPQHTAVFSVFDGIQWTEIQGTGKIESMSHLVAVINETSIALYVNGTLQETKSLPRQFVISDNELVTTSSDSTHSVSDIVIGAYISVLRSESQLTNKFSGIIDDATIYNRALTGSEIKQLFTSQIVEYVAPSSTPLFPEDVLYFVDIVTLIHTPAEINSEQPVVEEILGITDNITVSINQGGKINSLVTVDETLQLADSNIIVTTTYQLSNVTTQQVDLGIADILEIQPTILGNNTLASTWVGITDNVDVYKSVQQRDDEIIYEERGPDYYKVEYANGTGQITFGLPEWILDPTTNKYVEHIVTETADEITYDSMQIPFKFNKSDCSISIYEAGRIDSKVPVVGKKQWKLMESQIGVTQWTESKLNNESCRVQTFENSTGFYINALKENKDGKFLITYGKKIDEPLESFLYFTNTNENKTNTKFGFVQELEGIESDEADLGDQIVTSKSKIANKFFGKKDNRLDRFINEFDVSDANLIKELKQNEKLSKKKANLASDVIYFTKENQSPLILDFSKAMKEFSNLSVENKGGKLRTTIEFLSIDKTLKEGETMFLDPTVTIGGQTFIQAHAQGTGSTCPSPSNVSQSNSTTKTSITKQSSSTGCKRTSREFDIGTKIDSRAVITDVKTFLDVSSSAGGRTCEIRSMEIQPTTHTIGGTQSSPEPDAQILWNDIGNGTAYATAVTCSADNTVDLGPSADSDLQAAIDAGRSWFAIGLKLEDESRPVSGGELGSAYSKITLTVSYNFKSTLKENVGIRDSISFNKIVSKNLSEKLGIRDTVTLTKNISKRVTENLGVNEAVRTSRTISLTEKLGMSDAVSAKKTRITAFERLGITDTIQLTRTTGDQNNSESIGITDTIIVGKLNLRTVSENFGIRDQIFVTKVKSLTERVGIFDTITTQKFPGTEYRTQNGCTVIPDTSTSKTLTAGVDYVQPEGEAFIRIVDTRLHGIGRTSGGGTQPAERVTTYISDPDFAGGSITFTRDASAAGYDTRICWQIVDYQGLPTNANAIKVRSVGTVSYGASDLTTATPTISGVANNNKVVVFITGQSNVDSAATDWNTGLSTAAWSSTTQTANFTRGEASSDANSLSYAVVEFTGSNWNVQRIEHNYASTSVETEAIADVGSLNRAFFHHQHRAGLGQQGLDESGGEVYFSATNQLSFDLNTASTPSLLYAVVWVVSNTQVGDDAMIVQHVSGTRSGGTTEEYTENISINTVRGLTTTSIMGENTRTSGTGTNFPIGAIAFNLTATNNVKLITSDTAQTQNYRFQVVQWPTKPARTFVVSLTENLGIKDTVLTPVSRVKSLTELIGITDNVTTTAAKTKSLNENVGITDNIVVTVAGTKSLTENVGIADTLVTIITRKQTVTENLGITDTITVIATKVKSLNENLGITDNTARTFTKSLTESLGITDTVTTARTLTKSLTENLGITDNTARTFTRSLTEN